MEPEGLLPHSQQPATCPYPEQHRFSPCSPSYILQINFNIILPSTPGSSKRFLPSGLPIKTLYAPLLSPIHDMLVCLLDLITRMTFGEEYREYSSLLCSLLHSPFTSSLLGPNILSTLFSNTLNVCDFRYLSYPSEKVDAAPSGCACYADAQHSCWG